MWAFSISRHSSRYSRDPLAIPAGPASSSASRFASDQSDPASARAASCRNPSAIPTASSISSRSMGGRCSLSSVSASSASRSQRSTSSLISLSVTHTTPDLIRSKRSERRAPTMAETREACFRSPGNLRTISLQPTAGRSAEGTATRTECPDGRVRRYMSDSL